MTLPLFPFEGEMLRFHEIRKRVSALSETSVRRRLRLGLDTRQKMLAWDEGAARSRNGRKGRAAAEARGIFATQVRTAEAARNAAASGFVGDRRR